MRIYRLSKNERDKLRSDWHKWFAWHRVRVGPAECRWLEVVERKGTYKWFGHASWGWDYQYRAGQ